jgi:MOSC domain-containing protein YiiM
MTHLTADQLEAGLDEIRQAPRDHGVIELIARRPLPGERDILTEAELDRTDGLVGDRWSLPDAPRKPTKQLTVMNARVIKLLVPEPRDWPIAGDQIYVDLDLSVANVPPGTRLAIGQVVIEASVDPHRGCAKFGARFGSDALRWVSSDTGRALNLRGINALVIEGGTIRRGDVLRKL